MCRENTTDIMDNIIIMSVIIERRKMRHLIYLFFADAFKCFDKLRLKDCLIELKILGNKNNELKMLYEMNKRNKVTINTPFGETENT